MSQKNQLVPNYIDVRAIAKSKSSLRSKIGLEIWQVLTLITFTLTIASGLLWFNNLQPKSFEIEFVTLDKAKTKIYNDLQKVITDQQGKNFLANAVVLKDNCYKDVSKYKPLEENFRQNDQELTQFLQQIESAQLDIESQASTIKLSSGFDDYNSQARNYVQQLREFKQRQYDFWQKTFTIQTKVSELCQSKISDLPTKIQDLDDKLVEFDRDFSNYADWTKTVTRMSENLKKLIQIATEKGASSQEFRDILSSFRNDFIEAFNIKFDKLSEVKWEGEAKAKFDDSLNNLENWQQKQIQNNQNLRNKVVKIAD